MQKLHLIEWVIVLKVDGKKHLKFLHHIVQMCFSIVLFMHTKLNQTKHENSQDSQLPCLSLQF